MRDMFINFGALMVAAWFAKKKKQSPPQSKNQVLQSRRMEDEIYCQSRQPGDALECIRQRCEHQLPVVDNLSRDVFQSLYSLNVKHNEQSELSPLVRRFNRHILGEVMKSPDYPAMKSICEGRGYHSMESAAEFMEQVAGNLDELLAAANGDNKALDALEAQEQRTAQLLQNLRQQVQAQEDNPTPKTEQQLLRTANQLHSKEQQVERLNQMVRDNLAKSKAAREILVKAVEAANDKAQEVQSILRAWGNEAGEGEPSELDHALVEKIRQNESLPAKTADLERRWCSAALKISVSDAVLRNLDALKVMGECGKLPAKSSIAQGRWCSPTLKRSVGDSVLRDMEALQSIGTRRKFPAKGTCPQGRWCSGTLKASVEQSVTADLQRSGEGIRILVVSGERRDESTARSKYNEVELHRTNAEKKAHRTVHLWRAVIDYSERDVWELMRRHSITPHPCYAAGWNRCSCMMCIFSLPRHLAGIRELFPKDYEQLRQDEIWLGFTLDNKKTLDEYVGDAQSCVDYTAEAAIRHLQSGVFTTRDIYTPTQEWTFPSGAFNGALGGPC